MKFIKAFLIWLLMAPLGIINGILRETITEPLFGRSIALPLSGIILSIMIFILAYILVPKIGKCTAKEYIIVGIMWFVLANVLDFVVTLVERGTITDFIKLYDISTGNLWSVVVIVCLISPLIVAKIKKLA